MKYDSREREALEALKDAIRAKASWEFASWDYESDPESQACWQRGLAYQDCADLLQSWINEETKSEDLVNELGVER